MRSGNTHWTETNKFDTFAHNFGSAQPIEKLLPNLDKINHSIRTNLTKLAEMKRLNGLVTTTSEGEIIDH